MKVLALLLFMFYVPNSIFARKTKQKVERAGILSGFFVGFDVGRASLENPFFDEREAYGFAQFQIGTALSEHVLLGFEADFSARNKADSYFYNTQFAGIHAVSYLYPNTTREGFFIKGGLGVSTLEFSRGSQTTNSQLSMKLAAGVEAPIGGQFTLKPSAGLQLMKFTSTMA